MGLIYPPKILFACTNTLISTIKLAENPALCYGVHKKPLLILDKAASVMGKAIGMTASRQYKTKRTSFSRMPDERVALLGKAGDGEAIEHLLQKYKSVVLDKSRSYFLPRADRDDIIQEGMIGLFKAVRDFRPDRDCSFRTFADVCITRQIITAIKTSGRQKHLGHNSARSLDRQSPDDTDDALVDTVANPSTSDPEQLLIARESVGELRALLRDNLSQLEWSVFVGYSENKSYQEIAREQGCSLKSVDNALCRCKRKVQKFRAKADAEAALYN